MSVQRRHTSRRRAVGELRSGSRRPRPHDSASNDDARVTTRRDALDLALLSSGDEWRRIVQMAATQWSTLMQMLILRKGGPEGWASGKWGVATRGADESGQASTWSRGCVARTGDEGTAAHRAGIVDVGPVAKMGGPEGEDSQVNCAHASTTCLEVGRDAVLNVLSDKVDGAGNAT